MWHIEKKFIPINSRKTGTENPARIDGIFRSKIRQKFSILESGSAGNTIVAEKIFFHRLKYIHDNPVREKWHLCALPEDYRPVINKTYSP